MTDVDIVLQSARQECGATIRRVCVFCGSSTGSLPQYLEATIQFGRQLALSEIALVYGGGQVGLMGTLADTVLSAGGKVIGVMPQHLVEREIDHKGLTEFHAVNTMHERKMLMSNLSDAFVLLPGGIGSWEEFCEVVTWAQLGIHNKPCGILNVEGYYNALLSLGTRAVADGFMRAPHWNMITVDEDPERLLNQLKSIRIDIEAKWA
jgi:uncharacterized protein (TIGR00730 family)